MEKKILKWMTGCMGAITMMACLCLYFMPEIEEAWAMTLKEAQNVMQQDTIVEIEIQQAVQQNIPVEEEKEQLYIELPEGIDGKDISIENDYLHQVIYVRFARGIEDYAKDYSVRGSSNHIASLTYYKEGKKGVLELALDKVCEYTYSFKDGYLCMRLLEPHEIYDKVIVIDAGHGGKDSGAVKNGVEEKELNLDIVRQLKAIFEDAGDKDIKVYYTRLTDKSVSLVERAALANKAGADLFISVHNNASNSGNFNNENGTMVLYSPSDKNEYNSKRLAKLCLKQVTNSADSKDLGLRAADDIYVVRVCDAPAVLIEAGYMTNYRELDNLQDKAYQKKLAKGIYNAIMEAFEEGF